MKILTLVLVISFNIFLSNKSWSQEPSQLASLRASWQQARDRALQPIDGAYTQALQKLLDSLTKAGKLDEAMAVKSEFTKITGSSVVGTTVTPNGQVGETIIFVDRNWTTARGSHFHFHANGTGTQVTPDYKPGTGKGREIPVTWVKTPPDVCKDNANMITVAGESNDHKSVVYFKFTNSKEGVFGSSPDNLSGPVYLK